VYSPEKDIIVYLNMARVKLIASRAGLQSTKTQTEFHRIRIDKLTLALNMLYECIQVVHQLPDSPDEVQTKLPF